MYKIKDLKGKIVNGTAKLDFLNSKYKEKQDIKIYNFAKFTSGIAEGEEKKSKRTSLKNVHFSDDEIETDPIKLDTSNTNFLIDNDDAITYTFKKGKKSEN